MLWYQIFRDGPEYEARRKRSTFVPPNIALKDVHDAVPQRLFHKNTGISLLYILRHVSVMWALYRATTHIDVIINFLVPQDASMIKKAAVAILLRPALWIFYAALQGIAFAGLWCLGHEAGHGNLSPYALVNSILGLAMHAFLLVPYFSWRSTHRTHHKSTNNLERDETYIPPTRKDFKLPEGKVAVRMDYKEIIEETPGFTLFKLVMRQFLGYQLYLFHNRKGNPKYPPGTSHYKPSSSLFTSDQRTPIITSNVCIGAMFALLGIFTYQSGWGGLWCYYLYPWLWANNWIVTFTYLQHSDPTIPYYRKDQWTFARGALATVDRPLFGWIGRFMLFNIGHDHVAHHFFSNIPFYNLPEATEAIKPVLGEYYNYDSTNTFYALWRSFSQCIFVEDDGQVVFLKNQRGEAALEPRIL
ncbi:hypothetical protein HGRIS_012555 [Hohenbuehelia grisea]|uniref:Fatty acid desaturase domain-containing protein n=1 Tax=Hohenbuehelia grisea TaxID=104357 RepID=A0ABR3IST1_9AGAR